MKVLFLSPLPHRVYPLQIAAISAYLKRIGHQVEYMDLELGHVDDIGEHTKKQVEEKLDQFGPELIAFSTYDMYFDWTVQLCKVIKNKKDIPILAGGYLSTLYPQTFYDVDEVDFIGIGEGERLMENLLKRMEHGDDCLNIPGIYARKNGKFQENPVKFLIENVDELPFVDRELFDYQEHIGHVAKNSDAYLSLIASRGCSYKCTYCANEFIREKYENYKKFVRFRSPENICEEIEECARHYKFNKISFEDAMFTASKKWLADFRDVYSKRIGLPFYCNIRPEATSKEAAQLLADAGCEIVSFGLESGDPEMRKSVLGRYCSDKLLYRVGDNLREAGIKFRTFNMVGLPNETLGSLYRTLKMNFKLIPHGVQTSIYYPLRGTILGDKCYEDGLVDLEKQKKIKDYAFETPLKKQKLPNWVIVAAKWINSAIPLRSGNIKLVKVALVMAKDYVKSRLVGLFQFKKNKRAYLSS